MCCLFNIVTRFLRQSDQLCERLPSSLLGRVATALLMAGIPCGSCRHTGCMTRRFSFQALKRANVVGRDAFVEGYDGWARGAVSQPGPSLRFIGWRARTTW